MATYPFTTETLGRIITTAAHSYSFVNSLVKHFTLDSLPTDPAKLVLRAALGLTERANNISPAMLEQELHLLQATPGDVVEALEYLEACVDAYGAPTQKEQDELAALLGPMVRREVERGVIEGAVKLYGAGHSIADIAVKVQDAQNIGSVRHHAYADITPGQPMQIVNEHAVTLATGIHSLDGQLLSGGLEQRGLGLTLCETGGGKSMFLGHVAASALIQGKNVYVASLEMSENEFRNRVYRNIVGLDEKRIVADQVERDRRWAIAERRALPQMGQFRVGKFSPYVTSMATIKQEIDRLKWVPEVVVVDYIGRLKSNRSKGAMVDLNPRDLAIAMEELFDLVRGLNGWGWTASQINRDKTKNGPGVNQVAGSKEMATVASVILSMDMGDEMKDKGIASFRLVKNRHGASGSTAVEVITELDFARIEGRVAPWDSW